MTKITKLETKQTYSHSKKKKKKNTKKYTLKNLLVTETNILVSIFCDHVINIINSENTVHLSKPKEGHNGSSSYH